MYESEVKMCVFTLNICNETEDITRQKNVSNIVQYNTVWFH